MTLEHQRKTKIGDLFASNDSNTSDLVLNSNEALLAISLLATAADNQLSDEERGMLYANHLRIFKSESKEQIREMMDKITHIINQYSTSVVLVAAKKYLPPHLRESAFAIATDLVLVDGVFAEEEKQFLIQLWKALEISDEMGKKILDVMAIKNCGAAIS